MHLIPMHVGTKRPAAHGKLVIAEELQEMRFDILELAGFEKGKRAASPRVVRLGPGIMRSIDAVKVFKG